MSALSDPDGSQQTLHYDGVGRLTRAIDSAAASYGGLGYTYDRNGNRTASTNILRHPWKIIFRGKLSCRFIGFTTMAYSSCPRVEWPGERGLRIF